MPVVETRIAQVWKASDGSVKTWFVSTDTTDRRLWTSNDGVNWSFRGYNYDTDGGTVAITARFIDGGSNSSTHTVTAAAAPVAKKDPYAQNLVLALPLSVAGFDDVSSEIRGHGSAKAITSFSGSPQMVPFGHSVNTMDEAITLFAACLYIKITSLLLLI